MKSVIILFASVCLVLNLFAQEDPAVPIYKLDEIIYLPGCDMSMGDYMKNTHTYDQNGNLLTVENFASDDGDEWYLALYETKYEFLYDENGYLVKQLKMLADDVPMEGFTWDTTYMAKYTHNVKGELESFIEFIEDYDYMSESYQWEPIQLLNYTYQNDGKTVIYKLNIDWDHDNNRWDESSVSTHCNTFDGENRLVEIKDSQDIDDTNYISAIKTVMTYLTDNDLLSTETYVKLGNIDRWMLRFKTGNEYDDHQNMILTSDTEYDVTTGEIYETRIKEKYAYEYDEDDRMKVKIMLKPPYYSDEWVERGRYVYEYDENGFNTIINFYLVNEYYYRETGEGDSLVLSEQELFVYDKNGNKIEQTYKNYSEYDQTFVEGNKRVYSYDYSIKLENFKSQFETLKVPNVFNQSSMWNAVMEQLIFEDRVLVEEAIYDGYMEYQNEQGEGEIKWMEPCTQKYIYSKLE